MEPDANTMENKVPIVRSNRKKKTYTRYNNTDSDDSLLEERLEKSFEIKEIKENSSILDFNTLKKIKTLTSGAYFGELALLEKKPRAATIVCDTDCAFAVLEKDYFNWILSNHF